MMVIDATPEIAPIFWAMLSLLAVSGLAIIVSPVLENLVKTRTAVRVRRERVRALVLAHPATR